MFPRSLIVLAAALLLSGVAVAQGEIVIRPHDLRALADGFGGNQEVSLALPLRASCVGGAGESYHRQAHRQLLDDVASVEEVVELIQTYVLGSEHDQSRWMELRGGILWVSASKAAQQRIERLVTRLEQHLLRTVRVEVHLLPGGAVKETASAVLDGPAADELLEAFPPLHTAEAVLRLGQQGRIIAARREIFLRDFDVEVAQKSQIADPLVSPLLEGLELGVSVRPACDGRYLLHAEGRFCIQDGECRIVNKSSKSVGKMQYPRTRTAVHGGAALIDGGGGILLGFDGGPGSLWMVRAHPRAGAEAQPEEGPGIIPLGSLTRPPLDLRAPDVVGPTASGWGAGLGSLDFDDEEIEAPLLLEILARVTGISERHLAFLEGRVLVEDPKRSASILEALRPLRDRTLRNVSLELRLGLVKDAAVSGLLARPADELAAELPHAALGAGRLGDSILLLGGREFAYLKDFDVEIAQSAVICDPITGALFDGFAFSARSSLTASGSLQLAADFTFQHVLADERRFDPILDEVGAVDTPVASHVTGLPRLLLQNGEWSLLRSGPLVGTGKTLIAMVRARF